MSDLSRALRSVHGLSLAGTALTAALVLSATSTLAQTTPDSTVQEPRAEQMGERLNLDEAQRYQVQEIMQGAQERSSADRERLRELRKAMREASDDGQRAAISDEIGQITGRLAFERSTAQAAVREVLTPEQRAEMDAKREAAMEKRRQARENGEGRGRPWADGEHPGKGKGRPWADGEHPGKGKGRPWAEGEHPGKGKGPRSAKPDTEES